MAEVTVERPTRTTRILQHQRTGDIARGDARVVHSADHAVLMEVCHMKVSLFAQSRPAEPPASQCGEGSIGEERGNGGAQTELR